MPVSRYYQRPGIDEPQRIRLSQRVNEIISGVEILATECCYYVEVKGNHLTAEEKQKLTWLLEKPLNSGSPVSTESVLFSQFKPEQNACVVELGPRLSFTTAFSTNSVSACIAAGIGSVTRIEKSIIYRIESAVTLDKPTFAMIVNALHDRMTEFVYEKPLETFELKRQPQPFVLIDVMGGGMGALRSVNKELGMVSNIGLALDEWDLQYYLDLFQTKIKRNPTDVELFDLAQSNSEHSRHWFFKGKFIIDGKEESDTLFGMIMDTQTTTNPNNVIKFNDNSSGIQGFDVEAFLPKSAVNASAFRTEKLKRHIIYTAETHNFPTGVCPFPGAATGTGGRIRDVQAAGRGGFVIAGISAYSFGNLNIPHYELPWESKSFAYPGNFAKPLDVIIQASNGASDYGNKFGEPVICGFARSFGLTIPGLSERQEWIKPIMFSGGIGSIEEALLIKQKPEKGMLVVKLGGPIYRIGVGGGAASSVHVQGEAGRAEDLDFGAVQRGDPEMEQKLNKAIRACIECGPKTNPILSIHDQGAGGNGNVLKEIVEGAGAVIDPNKFELGDPTISILELWGAEYQESNAILIKPESQKLLSDICEREQCPVSYVGTVTGDNRVVLKRFADDDKGPSCSPDKKAPKFAESSQNPVDLDLDHVLAKMPQKVFDVKSTKKSLKDLSFPENLTFEDALSRVLRLPSVASKRYLTNKVDRSVTGLIAQQQCVGPLHTPLADVAVTALSYFDTVGSAVAVGEQPIKGIANAACGARMSVGESLTNLVFAPISEIKDVKCSGNWMWAAKLEGEGAKLMDACKAMCSVMKQLGIAVDGGKDSLSMAARVGNDVVKAPGTLVISSYAPCPDIRKVVTPDLKCPGKRGTLIYVRFGSDLGQHRLGGCALAHCFGQVGNNAPDLDNAEQFVNAFAVTQELVKEKLVTAGHDVSDGGLITCILEMAFAGNCGLEVVLPDAKGATFIELCFAEELGIVLEVAEQNSAAILKRYADKNVPCFVVGHSVGEFGPKAHITITSAKNSTPVLSSGLVKLRELWEETSLQLELFQCNPLCTQQERQTLRTFTKPPYKFEFGGHLLSRGLSKVHVSVPRVAVVREQGSNGDREMAAAFYKAGFETWDVCMQDLLSGGVKLDHFQGLAFVGGFSYADVLGSAKGWAGAIRFYADLKKQFDQFYKRKDSFSFGICNGCQLMALLGWIGNTEASEPAADAPVFLDENESGRFESRFATVAIEESPAIMLKGLAGSRLGIWVSHGEGRFTYKSDSLLQSLSAQRLIPLRYVDDDGKATSAYPLNPNGSAASVAAICSPDGRHLAIMPHPERCFLSWQWPYWPSEWPAKESIADSSSPWMAIFDNAYQWCCSAAKA